MTHCRCCDDTGHVCENHPDRPWDGISTSESACRCGGAGMPCPACCSPIPEDGRHSIREAFTPSRVRQSGPMMKDLSGLLAEVADRHRCTVQESNGSWFVQCPDCPGAVKHAGTGDKGKQEAERIGDEHYHGYHCADPDHECAHQQNRHREDERAGQFREARASLRAARGYSRED